MYSVQFQKIFVPFILLPTDMKFSSLISSSSFSFSFSCWFLHTLQHSASVTAPDFLFELWIMSFTHQQIVSIMDTMSHTFLVLSTVILLDRPQNDDDVQFHLYACGLCVYVYLVQCLHVYIVHCTSTFLYPFCFLNDCVLCEQCKNVEIEPNNCACFATVETYINFIECFAGAGIVVAVMKAVLSLFYR